MDKKLKLKRISDLWRRLRIVVGEAKIRRIRRYEEKKELRKVTRWGQYIMGGFKGEFKEESLGEGLKPLLKQKKVCVLLVFVLIFVFFVGFSVGFSEGDCYRSRRITSFLSAKGIHLTLMGYWVEPNATTHFKSFSHPW